MEGQIASPASGSNVNTEQAGGRTSSLLLFGWMCLPVRGLRVSSLLWGPLKLSSISGGYVSDRILIYALQTLSGPDIFLWVHQCPSKVIYLNMAPRLLETFQLA